MCALVQVIVIKMGRSDKRPNIMTFVIVATTVVSALIVAVGGFFFCFVGSFAHNQQCNVHPNKGQRPKGFSLMDP